MRGFLKISVAAPSKSISLYNSTTSEYFSYIISASYFFRGIGAEAEG